jgi:hypothetical protein
VYRSSPRSQQRRRSSSLPWCFSWLFKCEWPAWICCAAYSDARRGCSGRSGITATGYRCDRARHRGCVLSRGQRAVCNDRRRGRGDPVAVLRRRGRRDRVGVTSHAVGDQHPRTLLHPQRPNRNAPTSRNQRPVPVGPASQLHGRLLAFVGIGLALGNWLALLAAATLLGLLIRIDVEEGALQTNLGEPYRAYAKGKKRLVPRVW